MSGEDDSDLADLLGNQAPPPLNSDGAVNKVSADMNLDHLTRTHVSVSGSPKKPKHHRPMGFLEFISSYISMLCHYYPTTCGCCVMIFVSCVLILLANLIFNPTEEFGNLGPMDSPSKYDQALSKVDHWCLQGGNEHCACEDPLMPLSRLDHLSWIEAVKGNREIVEANPNPDVAILGESVVEAMGGRWMGATRSTEMETLKGMFQKKMSDDITGVTLGVAGDTAPNVLWRLLHGEMPDSFQPKVWWISLGMNDLARMECSEEIVMLGILRIVEEVLEKRPNAQVVVNSILPMGNVRSGAYPLLSDYQDAFAKVARVKGNRRVLEEQHRGLSRLFQRDKYDPAMTKFTPTTKEGKQAEREERLRDKKYARARRKKRTRAKDTVLNDRKKIKKYSLVGKAREKRLPLWTSIQAINKQLQAFCEKQAKQNKPVHFFNANNIFVENYRGRDRIKRSTITMLGYPRPGGFGLWEDAIVAKVKSILAAKGNEQANPLSLTEEDFFMGSPSGESNSKDSFSKESSLSESKER